MLIFFFKKILMLCDFFLKLRGLALLTKRASGSRSNFSKQPPKPYPTVLLGLTFVCGFKGLRSLYTLSSFSSLLSSA
uniref:Uncharacterized protein n=1 Tax=Populus trichocarpa TaxID=3694 RepID=U5FFS6_POPTR